MNGFRIIHYRTLVLVWLTTATAGTFVALARALEDARFIY